MDQEINDMLMKPVEYQRHFFNRMNSDPFIKRGVYGNVWESGRMIDGRNKKNQVRE